MASLNREILRELQRQNELLTNLAAAPAPAQEPEGSAPESGMMTDRDCLLICMADDVIGAVDRWNRSRRLAARGR